MKRLNKFQIQLKDLAKVKNIKDYEVLNYKAIDDDLDLRVCETGNSELIKILNETETSRKVIYKHWAECEILGSVEYETVVIENGEYIDDIFEFEKIIEIDKYLI